MFSDIIQEMLEAELDQELGYEKNDRTTKSTENSRNGYSKKTVKSELGNIELDIPDVVIFSVDGLTGMKEAIQAIYSDSEIQRCIIHQLRNSFRFVSYKHLKEFTRDFKSVYKAPSETLALENLAKVKEKWGNQYPYAFKSWEDNWDVLSTFLKFPEEIRTIMYTTNIIENLNRQYRKATKTKSVFPSDTALLKMLYLATMSATEKWTARYKNWDKILSQLLIFYPKLKEYI